jgi:KipI family sensor histidine kinase inhibitor
VSDAGFATERLGEDALLLRLGDTIDEAINARVHALAARIAASRPPWLRDLVPAYASLALFVDGDAFADDVDPLTEAGRWLDAQPLATDEVDDRERLDADDRVIEIPVRYGGEDGPDIDAVATHAGLSVDDVIALHCKHEYRVAMLGFAPGFPYLLGMDSRLAMPRLPTPRARVAAGSVGIGGAQTGIYPRSGPGGWRLIGRTTMALFDAAREPPAALAPGDRVRFVAIGSP